MLCCLPHRAAARDEGKDVTLFGAMLGL